MSKVRAEEQELHKKFIQRLFPEVQKLEGLPQNDWYVEVEKLVQNHVKALAKQQETESSPADVEKLQAQLIDYKNIIDDTVKKFFFFYFFIDFPLLSLA